jgi:hypothetical protein
MQNLIKRIFKGFPPEKAYQTPTLPDHILKFTMHPAIRIFRVIGGVSYLTMISKTHLQYPIYIFYIVIFISILFTIYHFYLNYHRIKHIRHLLKSGALEVRNSPLDRLAYLSAATRALMCLKGACDQAQPIGLGLGLMIAYDEILKGGNNAPIFMPLLGDMLNIVLPTKIDNTESTSKLITDALEEIKQNRGLIKANKSILEQVKDLNVTGDITPEESMELEHLLNTNQDSLQNKHSELKSKILELLDKE